MNDSPRQRASTGRSGHEAGVPLGFCAPESQPWPAARKGQRTLRPVRWQRALKSSFLLLVLLGCQADEAAPHPGSEPVGPAILLVTLEELSAEELVFDVSAEETWHRYRAIAASGSMVSSLASLATGLRPWQHGLLGETGKIHRGCERLASSLRSAGYSTYAWPDRARRLRDLGFARGFDEFGALRAGRQAVSVLDSMERGQFVWIHLKRAEGPDGTAKQLRRLDGLLTAARAAPSWSSMTVAIAGVTGRPEQPVQDAGTPDGFRRSLLEVPLALRSPSASGWTWSEAPLVGAARVYQTLADPAGVESLPAIASSLASPTSETEKLVLLTETYGRVDRVADKTANDFFVLRDGVQLRWTSWGPRGVADVPPLTGYGPVQLSLWTWGDEQPPRQLSDPALEQELAGELHQAWLADQDREEGMSWRSLAERQR